MPKKSTKEFSQVMYDQTLWVNEEIKKRVKLKGYTYNSNPDQYGIDVLILKKEKIIGGLEGEHHAKYWTGEFKFPTVHFLGRKMKYLRRYNYYIMVNADGSNCVMMPFNELKKYKLVFQNNSVCENEMIIEVPVDKCIWGWDKVSEYIQRDLDDR